jgi:hypothetical protein
MQELTMQEMTVHEIESVSGGLTAVEGAGLILGLTMGALASPVVVGVGFGAGFGLLIAHVLAL